ncbi:MAG: YqgE/AlgH family protein [Acidobacteriota bacterium]|nr:MAG: YqgE/AlgH family protein [Acidobacteriota bacterium]
MNRAPRFFSTAIFLVLFGLVSGQASQQETFKSLKGQLLVATGQVGDPRFSKSVIFLVEHSEAGAMGLIVNKVLAKTTLKDLFERIGMDAPDRDDEFDIHFGGPVEISRVFMLHSIDRMGPHSEEVATGIAFAPVSELLEEIGNSRGPEHHLLLVGYAGWGPQQLEGEIDRGDWLTFEAEIPLVFAEKPEETWIHLMEGKVFRL